MSWSFRATGTPGAVKAKFAAYAKGLGTPETNQSAKEAIEALGPISALLDQNFRAGLGPVSGCGDVVIVSLDASGSGYTDCGIEKARTTRLSLTRTSTRSGTLPESSPQPAPTPAGAKPAA